MGEFGVEDNDFVMNGELMDRNIEMPLVGLVDEICRNNILPLLRTMVRERRWMDAFEMMDGAVREPSFPVGKEHLIELLYGFFYWYIDREDAMHDHIKLEYFEIIRDRALASGQFTAEQIAMTQQLFGAILNRNNRVVLPPIQFNEQYME